MEQDELKPIHVYAPIIEMTIFWGSCTKKPMPLIFLSLLLRATLAIRTENEIIEEVIVVGEIVDELELTPTPSLANKPSTSDKNR